jgi:hypothetical protein
MRAGFLLADDEEGVSRAGDRYLTWKSVVSAPPFPSVRVLIDMTMRINETEIIKKQNEMLPAFSMRALPDGNRLGSTRLTARLQRMSVRLLSGSKMESAIVVKSASEPEAMAP